MLDSSHDLTLRIQVAEVLGWYNRTGNSVYSTDYFNTLNNRFCLSKFKTFLIGKLFRHNFNIIQKDAIFSLTNTRQFVSTTQKFYLRFRSCTGYHEFSLSN